MARRCCRRCLLRASNWRRMVIATAAFCTAAVTLLLTCSFPDPLPLWLFSPPAAALSSYRAETQIAAAAATPPGRIPQQANLPPPVVPIVSNSSPDLSNANDSLLLPVAPMVGDPIAEEIVDKEEESSGKNAPPAKIPQLLYLPPPTVTIASSSPLSLTNSGNSPLLPMAPKAGNPIAKEIVASEGESSSKGAPPALQLERPVGSLTPDEELLYAKKEIERSPLVADDPELYAPLFRNVSIFKRSYELMEKILKVYIYRDGKRPIFHTPPLKGIYASEGWFLKLMEDNKQFVVKEPNRAHLFYLPYSVRQLEIALYVPESHNIHELSLFLKNYVNVIASKYPFWNRTHGSDHFIVACHDWGPYTTKEHDELLKNTIKALCNADISEGIFVQGRDVSLPETTIKIPRRPLRGVGGKPVSQRNILAFYAGQLHGRVRPILVKYWDGQDDGMRIYGPLPSRVSKKMSYAQHMKSSKFCICPMGYEVNSPRIVEAIYYECVPVIIADNFVPPFDEVLDWNAFSVFVAEKDIPNLKDILLKISPEQYISMHANVQKLQKHFLWHGKPIKYDLFHMILHSIWFSRLHNS